MNELGDDVGESLLLRRAGILFGTEPQGTVRSPRLTPVTIGPKMTRSKNVAVSATGASNRT